MSANVMPEEPMKEGASAVGRSTRPILLDVSRLIWRTTTGRLPTGIDRVCLAYLEHFGGSALGVVQHKGRFWILSARHSKELFALLRAGHSVSRIALIALAGRAWLGGGRSLPPAEAVYLNVGHTGLNYPALPKWMVEKKLRPVFLIHDLIPITHPQYCRPGETEKHRLRMTHVLESATGVIGNSKVTIDDLAQFATDTGRPMPPSVVAWISGNPASPMARARSPISGPYFVTIGTIEARKNHLLLLRVWRRLASRLGPRMPKLIIIGQRGWMADAALGILDELGSLEGHVVELGGCSDQEMGEWLLSARGLLMPSHAEGFGLPVVEALELGTPVVASDLPVFREIAQDIPLFLDPNDEAGWEAAVEIFLEDSPERERQRMLASSYTGPDWPSHFAIVESFLQRL